MCGIIGFVNWQKPMTMRDILDILLHGLAKVEYRGYDSAGLAVDDTSNVDPSNGNKPDATLPFPTVVVRSVGNINQLRLAVDSAVKDGVLDPKRVFTEHVGIAHTRWATHGGVSKPNCHPHISADGSFTVVHNGIMTNFVQVKKELQEAGYVFRSNTDTEVIAVLAEHTYSISPAGTSFVDVMARVIRKVEGAFAILVKSTHYPNEIFGYRSGTPLIVGAKIVVDGESPEGVSPDAVGLETLDSTPSEVEFYFVSDCNSFLSNTRWAAFLDDGDLVHFADGSLSFYSSTNGEGVVSVSRPFQHLESSVTTLSKGSYPTFMLKEVTEQSETALSTLHNRLDFAERKIHLSEISPENIRRILASRQVFFISCGTSYHSCLAVRPLMEDLVMPVSVENASDFLDRRPRLTGSDTCIFVSQSGETADVLLALKHCKSFGAFTIGFNNVQGSSVDRLTDCSLQLLCGAEVGVASTKAYSSQLILLTIFVLALCGESPDPAVQARREEIIEGLSHLPQRIAEAVRNTTEPIKKIAKRLIHAPSIIVLGRGFDYATALETALKVKELSYVHTEGINSGELKHGPLALVDEMIHLLCFCSDDKYYEKSMNAIHQIEARGGKPIIVTNAAQGGQLLRDENPAREVLAVPSTVDCLQPVINVVPAQLLAYYMAVMRGNNVDCPRNLAKSVTVE